MTPATIPAVLLYWTAAQTPPHAAPTWSNDRSLRTVEEAAADLDALRPTLVRAKDWPMLAAARGLEQSFGGADVPTGTAQAARKG